MKTVIEPDGRGYRVLIYPNFGYVQMTTWIPTLKEAMQAALRIQILGRR
jgi:hypothetical protein